MEKKKRNKIRCHSVLDTESSTHVVTQDKQQRQAWKTLKPCGPLVQGDDTNLMGFTLIELLVVVLIIGILAAVALPQYKKTVRKARLVQGIVFVKAIHDAQENFYLKNGEYTTDLEVLDLDISCPQNYNCDVTNQRAAAYEAFSSTMAAAYGYNHRTDYPALAGKLYCSAKKTDQQAVKICSGLGSKIEIDNTDWNTYAIN